MPLLSAELVQCFHPYRVREQAEDRLVLKKGKIQHALVIYMFWVLPVFLLLFNLLSPDLLTLPDEGIFTALRWLFWGLLVLLVGAGLIKPAPMSLEIGHRSLKIGYLSVLHFQQREYRFAEIESFVLTVVQASRSRSVQLSALIGGVQKPLVLKPVFWNEEKVVAEGQKIGAYLSAVSGRPFVPAAPVSRS